MSQAPNAGVRVSATKEADPVVVAQARSRT